MIIIYTRTTTDNPMLLCMTFLSCSEIIQLDKQDLTKNTFFFEMFHLNVHG